MHIVHIEGGTRSRRMEGGKGDSLSLIVWPCGASSPLVFFSCALFLALFTSLYFPAFLSMAEAVLAALSQGDLLAAHKRLQVGEPGAT